MLKIGWTTSRASSQRSSRGRLKLSRLTWLPSTSVWSSFSWEMWRQRWTRFAAKKFKYSSQSQGRLKRSLRKGIRGSTSHQNLSAQSSEDRRSQRQEWLSRMIRIQIWRTCGQVSFVPPHHRTENLRSWESSRDKLTWRVSSHRRLLSRSNVEALKSWGTCWPSSTQTWP